LLNEREEVVLANEALLLGVNQQEEEFEQLRHYQVFLDLALAEEDALYKVGVHIDINLVGAVRVQREEHAADLVAYC